MNAYSKCVLAPYSHFAQFVFISVPHMFHSASCKLPATHYTKMKDRERLQRKITHYNTTVMPR